MKTYTEKELRLILKQHEMWLINRSSGKRASFRGADLRGASFRGADLRGASLRGADLRGANLRYANLSDANFSDANFRGANLRGANLSDANFRSANFRGADLRGADLTEIRVNECTSQYALQCPETGSFDAWKKCTNDVIVKLRIPSSAKRSSATTRKCRCSKAKVLEVIGAEVGVSNYNSNFIYKKGETVEVEDFDKDRWNECSSGIHFFLTRAEAESY